MAHAKYELRLDLSGVDLAALQTDDDFRRYARRLLPAALEDLGRAMAELAWDRLADGPAAKHRDAGKERGEFVAEAGRTYRRHAPAEERRALEELIVWHLRAAKRQASTETKDEPVWPVPPAAAPGAAPGTGTAAPPPAYTIGDSDRASRDGSPVFLPGAPMTIPPPPASVLVIEDNMDAADSLARFLRIAAGYQVRVAYDGAAGVKAAVAEPPDAVVCDISLPRLHGFAVAQTLADRLPAKPLLIAVTAFGGIYPEEQARAAGFDYYLTKPADPFALERLIRDHPRPARPAG